MSAYDENHDAAPLRQSTRMADAEFERRVRTEGTWRADGPGEARTLRRPETAETRLAMEARRARAEETRLREENAAQLVEIRRLEVVAIERATEIHRLKKSVADLESRLAAVVERHT